MTWHERERSELVRALTDAGPTAPTLCEGWESRHLAAHLVLREHNPVAAAGVAVAPLAGRTERAVAELADTATDSAGYLQLIGRIAAGPPRWSPMAWAGEATNLVEFFVHTEDVRRGGGSDEPLVLDPEHTAALWRRLVRMAPLLYRRSPVGIVLVVPGGPRKAVRRARGDAGTVVVRGDPGELLLHSCGRRTAARVHVLGDPVDIAALTGAQTP